MLEPLAQTDRVPLGLTELDALAQADTVPDTEELEEPELVGMEGRPEAEKLPETEPEAEVEAEPELLSDTEALRDSEALEIMALGEVVQMVEPLLVELAMGEAVSDRELRGDLEEQTDT